MAEVIIRLIDNEDGGVSVRIDHEGDTERSMALRVAAKLLTVLPWHKAEAEGGDDERHE